MFQRGKYPWIAAVNFNGNTGSRPGGCAATLVAANWAVTAAHCIPRPYFLAKFLMSIVLGEHDISSIDSSDTLRKNVKLAINPIVHEKYNFPLTHQNDIALLKLAEAVDLATFPPACLPVHHTDFTGQKGWVYGEDRLPITLYSLARLLTPSHLAYLLTPSFLAYILSLPSLSRVGNCLLLRLQPAGRPQGGGGADSLRLHLQRGLQ